MSHEELFLAGSVALVLAVAGGALLLSSDLYRQEDQRVTETAGANAPLTAQWREPILPLPPHPEDIVPGRAELGMRLFHDTRLSKDDTVACASCHDLNTGGVDGKERSTGVGGALGTINTPTVFNARYNFVQFWDGWAKTLAEQAEGPVHNPVEMASSWPEVLAKLGADAYYPGAFIQNYPGRGMTAETVVDAIVEFEKTLVTPSRFDRYLWGDRTALTEEEKAGYARFKSLGCASCHQGINVGGNLYQRFGIMADIFADQEISEADLGRFNVTGKESDRHVFKVPSLRNVELTAPYFHDGRALALESAIAVMGAYQLGRPLSQDDIRLVAAFLKTLTGRWIPPAHNVALRQAQGEQGDDQQ